MPKGTVFSKAEIISAIVLLINKYPDGLTLNMMQNIIGGRKKKIKEALHLAIEDGKVREVMYGKIAVYKLDSEIIVKKEDIRVALDYFYGKRCKEKHSNCMCCKVHEWLDNIKEE